MIYNDFDRHACAWLRELIKAGHLPEGTVDERSIKDVRGDDIRDARQWHTFAGIGGWPYALRLAGWPESIRTWTGSCPCQPYSAAGKGKGDADERNLWPDFYRLIRECRPNVVFGEQVENAVGHGWLDGVFADLEREGYACGAAVLGAHSVGAPHIRQRLYWVANAQGKRKSAVFGGSRQGVLQPNGDCSTGRMVNTVQPGPEGFTRNGDHRDQSGRFVPSAIGSIASAGSTGFWDQFDIAHCEAGKTRRIEPGTSPLAHGVSGRVGLLRGYGNAIVPQAGAAFITAFMQSVGIQREGTRHV
jgi:DNA (cytosine-5)-methyltransferase 1